MVDANFKKAVSNNKLQDIRDFLRMRLTLDHNYVSGMFIECRDYCFSHGITESYLYEKFDGRELPYASTEDNFTTLLGQLSTNFAKERVNRLLEIGKKLWPEEQTASEKHEAAYSEGKADLPTERRIISEKAAPGSQQGSLNSSGRRIISERRISTSTENYGDNNTNHKTYHKENSYKENPYGEYRYGSDNNSKSNNAALIVGAAIVVAGVVIAVALLC